MIKYFCDICGKELDLSDAFQCKMPRYVKDGHIIDYGYRCEHLEKWVIKEVDAILCDECVDMVAKMGMNEVIE